MVHISDMYIIDFIYTERPPTNVTLETLTSVPISLLKRKRNNIPKF